MTVKELVLLVLGFVLINNYALTSLFGLTPLLGFARRGQKLLVLGLAVTGMTLAAAVLLWLLRDLIPPYWTLLALALIVLALAYLLQLALGKPLGFWFPVLALNSAVFALALQQLQEEDLLTLVLSALGVGLGFLLGLFLLHGVQERLEEEAMPKAFRGFPIQLLAAGIVALALTAFQFV